MKKGIQDQVFAILMDRPNQDVHIGEIVLQTSWTEPQIRAAIGHLKKRHGIRIDVVLPGTVWRYNTAGRVDTAEEGEGVKAERSKAVTVYELIGVTRDGGHIIQDDAGVLYRAVPL